MIDKQKQGRINRQSGSAWEHKVRDDMIAKGWNVSKFQSNVQLQLLEDPSFPHFKNLSEVEKQEYFFKHCVGELIPAKNKYSPFRKAMMVSAGFPDFICWRIPQIKEDTSPEIIGVEAKINGYLEKVEKAKCKWLIENRVFSKIFIAKKKKVGRKVIPEYINFAEKYL